VNIFLALAGVIKSNLVKRSQIRRPEFREYSHFSVFHFLVQFGSIYFNLVQFSAIFGDGLHSVRGKLRRAKGGFDGEDLIGERDPSRSPGGASCAALLLFLLCWHSTYHRAERRHARLDSGEDVFGETPNTARETRAVPGNAQRPGRSGARRPSPLPRSFSFLHTFK